MLRALVASLVLAAPAAALTEPWLAADSGALGAGEHVRLAESGGRLYAAWDEGGRVRAAVLTTGAAPSWSPVGGALNRDPARPAAFPALAAVDGVLYAAWHEHSGTAWQVRAAAFDGTSWSFADGGGPAGLNASPAASALHPALAAFSGRLYAAWQESAGGRRRVRVAVRGASGAWVRVDGTGLAVDPARDAVAPVLAVHGGRLYLAWHEDNGAARRVRAAVYGGDDAAPAWSLVDGAGPGGVGGEPGRHALFPVLASGGGALHAAWYELTPAGRQVRVAAYDGDAWSFVDGGGLAAVGAEGAFPRLAAAGGRLYAAWQSVEGGARRVRAAALESGAWSPVGSALLEDPARSAAFPDLAPYGTGLALSWQESSGAVSLLRAARLEGLAAAEPPAPSTGPAPPPAPPYPAAVVLTRPEAGLKLGGNRVTLEAAPARGAELIVAVRFQVRRQGGPWTDAVPADPDQPNPARAAPYRMAWDLSDPAAWAGELELRAVAVTAEGEDPAPAAVLASVDAADPDLEERELGLGAVAVRRRCANDAGGSVLATEPDSGLATTVTLPAGSLDGASAVLRVETDPAAVPPAPGLSAAGVFREITLETGQTRLRRPAALVIAYPDADGDGYVDGTGLRAELLRAYSYDPAAGRWVRDFESRVDLARRAVVAETPHLSLFGLFAPAAANLSAVRAYPVPFVPGDGSADNGKPFSAGDPTSGILFDGLTADASVRVYAVTGELVWEGAGAGAGGLLRWDVRNSDGRDVASGAYFAVIESPATGEKTVRRLAVVR